MALLGFAPDAPMMTDGALLDCLGLIPSSMGMRPAHRVVGVGADPLPGDVRGAILSINLAGVRAIYAGTGDALYKLTGNQWTDVSGGTYAIGAEGRWDFAQFGDDVLAASKAEDMQKLSGATFATIANAPKANILVSLKGFVMAFDTNDATYGNSPDRWWCSAYLDVDDWVPNVATLCTTGRLVESAGPIVAAERLGDDVVVYKRDSVYVGRFTGPAEVWNFAQADAEVGCVGKDAICSTGTVHYFVGRGDLYMFDGVRVQSIARGVLRTWYRQHRDPDTIHQARAYWDKDKRLAWFLFLNSDGEACALVYSPDTNRWGRTQHKVQSFIRYTSPAVTYDVGTDAVTDYDSGPDIPYDSSFWVPAEENMAAFDENNKIVTFTGAAAPATFTTGDYGNENEHTWCDRLTLRLQGEPQTAIATGFVKDSSRFSGPIGSSAVRDDGAFDMRQRGRWHRFQVDTTGDYQLIDIQPRLRQAGYR